jgi:hypothetical protein
MNFHGGVNLRSSGPDIASISRILKFDKHLSFNSLNYATKNNSFFSNLTLKFHSSNDETTTFTAIIDRDILSELACNIIGAYSYTDQGYTSLNSLATPQINFEDSILYLSLPYEYKDYLFNCLLTYKVGDFTYKHNLNYSK